MPRPKKHLGIIRHTVPEPQVFYGSVGECADKMGISYRSALVLFKGEKEKTRQGWKKMTDEEFNKYYQPPRAPAPSGHNLGITCKDRKYWVITFLKDWKPGDPYPKSKQRIFTGSPSDFTRMMGCNGGIVNRLIRTQQGELKDRQKLKSYKGWAIARVRKYSEPKRRHK